jgi:hypothetical protein
MKKRRQTLKEIEKRPENSKASAKRRGKSTMETSTEWLKTVRPDLTEGDRNSVKQIRLPMTSLSMGMYYDKLGKRKDEGRKKDNRKKK